MTAPDKDAVRAALDALEGNAWRAFTELIGDRYAKDIADAVQAWLAGQEISEEMITPAMTPDKTAVRAALDDAKRRRELGLLHPHSGERVATLHADSFDIIEAAAELWLAGQEVSEGRWLSMSGESTASL